MAPGRVGLKVFLNLLHERPIETGLTPEEHETVKEMFRIHAAAAPTPPKSQPSPLAIMKSPDSMMIKKKKITKQPKRGEEEVAVAAPPDKVPLPREYRIFIARKGGCEVMLLLGKRLTNTDISVKHDRVTMSPKKIKEVFLNPPEAAELAGGGKVGVRVFDPSSMEHHMYLATWNNVYALHHGWKKIVGSHHLRVDDAIQVWSFRVDASLCFLIHKL